MRIWNILALLFSLTVASVEATTPACDKDSHDFECRKYPHSPYSDIRTEQLLKEVPPGIVFEQDPNVLKAYKIFMGNQYFSSYQASGSVIGQWIMGANPRGIATHIIISDTTKMRSPAFYFTAAKMGILTSVTDYDKLESQNPGLYNFVEALGKYFTRWINKNHPDWERIELEDGIQEQLIKSLIILSGKRPKEYKSLNGLNLDEQRQYLQELSKRILDKGIYEEMALAQWCAMILTDHYINRFNKDRTQALKTKYLDVNGILEKSFRQSTFKLRPNKGDPKYYE